jgi:hypothetical protein
MLLIGSAPRDNAIDIDRDATDGPAASDHGNEAGYKRPDLERADRLSLR